MEASILYGHIIIGTRDDNGSCDFGDNFMLPTWCWRLYGCDNFKILVARHDEDEKSVINTT